MRRALPTTVIVILTAVPAFVLGPVLWSPSIDLPTPTPLQDIYLMLLELLEALAFGVGVAFLLLHQRSVRQRWGRGVALSAAWFLLVWWVHTGVHVRGADAGTLRVALDVVLHVLSLAAGFTLAFSLTRSAKRPSVDSTE